MESLTFGIQPGEAPAGKEHEFSLTVTNRLPDDLRRFSFRVQGGLAVGLRQGSAFQVEKLAAQQSITVHLKLVVERPGAAELVLRQIQAYAGGMPRSFPDQKVHFLASASRLDPADLAVSAVNPALRQNSQSRLHLVFSNRSTLAALGSGYGRLLPSPDLQFAGAPEFELPLIRPGESWNLDLVLIPRNSGEVALNIELELYEAPAAPDAARVVCTLCGAIGSRQDASKTLRLVVTPDSQPHVVDQSMIFQGDAVLLNRHSPGSQAQAAAAPYPELSEFPFKKYCPKCGHHLS